MRKVIVFAGTTEGYEISRFLADHSIQVSACVATEYGSKSLTAGEYLKVYAKRLTENEMEQFFLTENPELVIDATHPYAAEVTANIRQACSNQKIEYLRILRSESRKQEQAVYVDTTDAAADFLNSTDGNALLTTGSKELSKFIKVKNYKERLYARVLSLPSVMNACSELGFEGKNLIGMQGPFSKDLNKAMLLQYDCKYLVTKDSGKAGGFQEKIEAALECGAIPVIIGRPVQEEGLSLTESKKFLAEKLGFEMHSQVTLLGIGMGSQETLTIAGKQALDQADLVIGAKRMVDSVIKEGQSFYYEYRSKEICDYIRTHSEYEKVVVVLSGDVGFYSGARKLLELLGNKTQVLCGISSVVFFMSKIHMAWDDAKIVSSHGKGVNLISLIKHHHKVFSILGTADGISNLAKKLVEYGMENVKLYVGENLSYDNETIFVKKASELTQYAGCPLSVVCAVNDQWTEQYSTHGIGDHQFIRGKAPMTKEEVRSVSLAKLCLTKNSICYDVGAGTGSVSVEMALRAEMGKVYAIEKKEDALSLIQENKIKFAVDNLEIIGGTAPEAMEELPVPSHAFIGGSSGNLKEIVKALLEKNPDVKIVINCITLETIAEALEVIKAFAFEETDIVTISAARSKALGSYHLMMGENPIYVITCKRGVVS